MKKMIKVACLSALAACASVVYAGDVENGVVNVEQDLSFLSESQKYAVEQFRLGGSPKFSVKGKESTNEYAPQMAATGIEYFEVEAVLSSNSGNWELLNSSQFSTSFDHGGAELYVAVAQIGYGNPNNATFNGQQYSHFLSDRLCGFDYHPCRVGETITAWRYYYDLSGGQNGQFQASANSVAFPFGYWSDSINIR